MKLKPIDYKACYQQNYKNLPNVAFWVTAIIYWLAGIILFFVLCADAMAGVGFLCLCLGGVLGFVFGYINRIWLATVISQKVVVADTLLEINKRKCD